MARFCLKLASKPASEIKMPSLLKLASILYFYFKTAA